MCLILRDMHLAFCKFSTLFTIRLKKNPVTEVNSCPAVKGDVNSDS